MAEVGQLETSRDLLGPVFFRSINDRICEQLETNLGVEAHASDLRDFICECPSLGCISRVRATVPEFDAIRDGENLFLIDPNHDTDAPDRLVRKTPRFAIVELRRLAASTRT